MNAFTVSDINRFIKQILSYEDILYGISVEGEVSNFKYHSSRNIYFTLKDNSSTIRCVIFKKHLDGLDFLPEDGMQIVVTGDIGVYEAYGQYQLYGSKIFKCRSIGAIKTKIDKIKNKLRLQGFFKQENKKPIPNIAKIIGIITAKGGAAINDMINIISRRFPLLKLKVYFSIVQGKKAKSSIIKALNMAGKADLDVLILARGGGSKEDLSVFDEEDLAVRVANFKIPVISAIGHENDWSVVDFVSDIRASTPSEAAEMVSPDITNINENILNFKTFFYTHIKNTLDEHFFKVKILSKDIKLLLPNIDIYENKIINIKTSLKAHIFNTYIKYMDKVKKNLFLLEYLNPELILNRGYGAILGENKKILRSLYKVKVGSNINIRLKDGEISAVVVEKTFNKSR